MSDDVSVVKMSNDSDLLSSISVIEAGNSAGRMPNEYQRKCSYLGEAPVSVNMIFVHGRYLRL